METDSIIPQLIANSVIAGSLYALLALGFNLIYGTTKFFNLAHGAVAVLGGYIMLLCLKSFGFPVWVASSIAILGAGLAGYLFERFVYEPLRARKASGMVLLIASLGIFTVIQAVIAMIFTSQFQTLSTAETGLYKVYGAVITEVQLMVMISVVVISVLLALTLKYTIFGKAIRAINDDEEVSEIVGINTKVIIRRVVFIGSAIAGVAGILIGFDVGLEPTMGLSLLMKGVIASIVGGIGNVYGGVVGGFILGFVENFGIWKISGEWKDAIAFALLIVFLVVRPQGLFKK